jgi:NTE family protein
MSESSLALVMSGGGARSAYQVGVLQAIAARLPGVEIPILTGVSAGAINAAYLANHVAPLPTKVEGLSQAWSSLKVEKVFRADAFSLGKSALRWGTRLVSGARSKAIRVHGLVDTAPLAEFLEGILGARDGELDGVEENLRCGALEAVAITASSYATGQSITWVQGNAVRDWERAHRRSRAADLAVRHVMASSALPIFFPAVEVDGQWFGDGGIRLTAPLSPAVHLGAARILAISTRYRRSIEEADSPSTDGYPPPAQIAGTLFNAIFLDVFDGDMLRLQRINELLERIEPTRRMGLRPIELLLLRPSRDLGKLANEYEADLPRAFRFMTRGLGTRETRTNDLLSLVMFQPDYIDHLMRLGRADAEARWGEIEAFLGRAPAAERAAPLSPPRA